jgi:hypothetical protein
MWAMKTYVREMRLRRWFPPRDRFAATVARLCILREDFALEMWGIHASGIKALDKHSAQWRRMYFWRSLVRTLWEIRRALETLLTVTEFKRALVRRPAWKKKFDNLIRKLAKNAGLVQRTRDSLGGHVLQRSVENALDGMTFDRYGYVEVGRTLKDLHYKFAGELVGEILLAGVPEAERIQEAEIHFRTIAELLPVFEIIDIIFTIYADSRKLV